MLCVLRLGERDGKNFFELLKNLLIAFMVAELRGSPNS